MNARLCLVLAALLPLCAAGMAQSADTLTNIPRPAPQQQAPQWVAPGGLPALLTPGTLIRLPDGRQSRIVEVLPEGGVRTDLGVVLTPEGLVQGAAEAGPVTVLEPASGTVPGTASGTEPAIVVPEQDAATAQKTPDTPNNPAATAPGQQPPDAGVVQVPPLQTQPGQIPEQKAGQMPPAQAGQTTQTTPQQVTIVELLPMTPTPATRPGKETVKPEAAKQEAPKASEAAAPAQKETPKKEAVRPEAQQQKAQPQKTRPEKAQAGKAETPKTQASKTPKAKTGKAAIGEELRIPPEAAATGNLDFLEGCWQGTRPEYYSKRIIKECFCFGAGGGAGKRRVIDSIGGRMCIGSSKARLSKDGVLSVTSSGAACTDGERWGQAEMVCRGTGQHAPCSWVFRDANGGRQSYQIPFVRVESCGR